MSRLLSVAALGCSAILVVSSPAKAVIAEGVITGVLLNSLHDKLADLINKSRESGDFLVWRVAITGRDLVDAIQKSNVEVLDKAFEDLDRQKQDVLRSLDANISKITHGGELVFNRAENFTGEWTQIISSTYHASSRPYVMSYSPRVLIPDGNQTVNLRVNGPNIGKSSPKIEGKQFEAVKPIAPVEQTAVFEIKKSSFLFPEYDSIIQKIDVSYSVPKYVVFSDKSTNNLELWLLPRVLGHYKISTRVASINREIGSRTIGLGQFKGRNSRIYRNVVVPDAQLGWRLDLNKRGEIRLHQGGADKGRCEGIDHQSVTENGLTMFARVDNRDQVFGRRDAWTDCAISIPVYRETKIEVDGTGAEGDLSWTKDVSFKLPDNLMKLDVKVDIFDKRSRIFTGAGTDKYFDLRTEGGQVIFRPNPPRDF